MMPQNERSSESQKGEESAYGRYGGNDMPYIQQGMREETSGKIYPLSRDQMKTFRLALPIVSLVLLVVFGLIFVVGVGGLFGWLSFVAACFVICCVLAYTFSITQVKD